MTLELLVIETAYYTIQKGRSRHVSLIRTCQKQGKPIVQTAANFLKSA